VKPSFSTRWMYKTAGTAKVPPSRNLASLPIGFAGSGARVVDGHSMS